MADFDTRTIAPKVGRQTKQGRDHRNDYIRPPSASGAEVVRQIPLVTRSNPT